MDIEEYLKQKRELEAKKELLEAKDRLKGEKEKKKPDERHDDRKISAEKSIDKGPRPEPSIADLFRKMVFWNIFILLIIVVLFAAFYFLPKEVSVVDNNGKEQTNVGLNDNEEKNATDEEKTITNTTTTNTTDEPEKYPGPEFTLWAEDRDLGPFDERGRIDGETLIVTAKYYDDAVIFLQSSETSRIACFVDRQVTVDSDGDGKTDLRDFDLDFTKVELNPLEKFQWSDSLPGAFQEGEYAGGKVTVEYEGRCYYCKDKFCDSIDMNGESMKKTMLKFTSQTGSS